MSIKLLKRLSCGIISGVCCCLFCLLLATAANADVCFLPTGQCEAASADLSTGCSGFNLTGAKDETGWNCTQCGEKWKCEKKSCKDDYKTDVRCSGTETKVCDETRKAGDESCCKCEDSVTKCQHEGYVYKKTSTNENCKNKCPYNGDYYESCECNAKYDKSSNTNACYTYNTCELGDLAGTKKYEQASDVHKCKDYMDNAEYVTDNSEQVKSDDYDCTLVCTETCDNSNRKYYQCSPKKDDDPCENGPYSWRDTECCAKDKWKDTVYCRKPTCTITAGDKKFTDLIYPYQVTDFVPKVCDDRLKEGLGIGNLQYGCSSRNTNYVLGMIRYCGGINDFAGIDDINALAGEMYGRSFTNNAAPGVYERCEISASKLPKYTGFTGSAGASTLYNKIKSHALGRLDDFWINVRECYNGDESGMVNFFFDSYKYGVFHAPVLSSNPYNRGMCVCRDAVDCTGCDYCIAGTCKSSGENRIISDSSTYEKCADSCGGKYRCKSGYTPSYAGSNQYKCVPGNASCDSSLGEYERESDCKIMGWPCAKEGNCWKRTKAQITYARSNTCNPVLIVQGSATTVTITPNTNTTNQQQFVDAGNNELTFGLSTGIPSSFKIGGPDGTTTLTATVTGSHGTIGTYNFKAGKSYQITPNCNDGDKVTVYYDAPTNCNAPMRLTHQSSGVTIMTAATTNNVPAGTYTISPSSGSIQSYTIRMGRGGTPSTKTGTTTYTFSAGNEYWIVPNCSSGGGCQNNSDCNGGAHTACGIRWTACMEMTSNAYSYCMGQAGQSSMMQGACSGMYAANKATCNNYKNYECMICQSGACLPDPVEPNWSSRLQHYSN